MVSVSALVLVAVMLGGCADMEFSQKNYKFEENQKRTLGMFITEPGEYKIDEINKGLDPNGRVEVEKEACKGWKGNKVGEGCLFSVETKGLAVGEQIELIGKYEREPATVETPIKATIER